MFFLMYTDMTAVTIHPNKIVLNEVKDNSELLEPSYEKTKQTVGQLNRIATAFPA